MSRITPCHDASVSTSQAIVNILNLYFCDFLIENIVTIFFENLPINIDIAKNDLMATDIVQNDNSIDININIFEKWQSIIDMYYQ